ncbi:CPBP family intramembrane glutamic endopeptidase [Facklamia lactis]|uniref:CPBP family intramembrane glutamic endopeptidase n=1 Tax=Facklamia lactis TaxID=2749967 RepID=UPI0018CC951B|nr:type II CAAX endopeptidase family protein [Facklamia lactis]MBG9980399.1 CPBP family intramembrane metalloprotease [Facklamia lactis]
MKSQELQKIAVGIATMYGVYWIYSLFIQSTLGLTGLLKSIIGMLILYGLGLFIFVTMIRPISNSKINNETMSVKTILMCFILQFSALLVHFITANIFSKITGSELEGSSLETLTPYMLFILLIFNPIIEEFVFRKLFALKLLKHGEIFYILSSSFCFAIVHGVSLGIPSIIYTFLLGLIWSYIYVKTGNFILIILMHSLSNFFGSVLPQYLLSLSLEVAGIYVVLAAILGLVGFVLLFINRRKIILDNKNRVLDINIFKEIISNKGIIFYIGITVFMMIVKKFMVG